MKTMIIDNIEDLGRNHSESLEVDDLTVRVTWKRIKNLHVGVYPPDGEIRVSAPLSYTREQIIQIIQDKKAWIEKHQLKYAEQPREARREMVSGENHYYLGLPMRLKVVYSNKKSEITTPNKGFITMSVRQDSTREFRLSLLTEWYRENLEQRIDTLMTEWTTKLGLEDITWRIRRMKTQWGNCEIETRTIGFNLSLARVSVPCLEYVIVYELCYFIAKTTNVSLLGLLDKTLPNWRFRKEELSKLPPLSHHEWN